MATVWAFSGIQSAFKAGGGWTHAIPFKGLEDLVVELGKQDLTSNTVSKLAIVSHGDNAGVVQLTPPLTTASMTTSTPHLRSLRDILEPGARVVFYACQVAGGSVGDTFLMSLSRILAGCEVVGFMVANEAFAGVAGSIKVFDAQSSRNDEYSEDTKWAQSGHIVRPPYLEVLHFQQSDPSKKNRCGSDSCLGHAGRGFVQRCSPYKRSKWPAWARDLTPLKK
jgi:hypothetical protein